MAMRMLEAGGMPVVTDGVRAADDSNPNGYYELEPVKDAEHAAATRPGSADARGKAVKIISFLLTYLPESYDYQVIFMRRDLNEIVASQNKMLDARGEDHAAPPTTACARFTPSTSAAWTASCRSGRVSRPSAYPTPACWRTRPPKPRG